MLCCPQVLAEFKELKNCVACCHREGLYVNLETQQRELEICKKALNDYMESKRRAFPRFYFVSAADLLDILSNGNNPARVQIHMNKCFQVGVMPGAAAFLQLCLLGWHRGCSAAVTMLCGLHACLRLYCSPEVIHVVPGTVGSRPLPPPQAMRGCRALCMRFTIPHC